MSDQDRISPKNLRRWVMWRKKNVNNGSISLSNSKFFAQTSFILVNSGNYFTFRKTWLKENYEQSSANTFKTSNIVELWCIQSNFLNTWIQTVHRNDSSDGFSLGKDESRGDQSDVMPTGRVVGVVQRNWRDYVASFAENEVNASSWTSMFSGPPWISPVSPNLISECHFPLKILIYFWLSLAD